MRLVSLLILLLSIPATLLGQVTLTGSAPSYKGQTITFLGYADFITNTEEELGKCEVSKKGEFQCDIKTTETSFIFTDLGIYRGYIFVEPHKTYRIVLPEYQEKSEEQRLNPFFKEVEVQLGIEQMAPNDLNYLISSFDLLFNENFDLLIQQAYAGNKYLPTDSIISSIENRFAEHNHSFFNTYRTYRYGLLKQLVYMQQSKSISKNYFAHKPIRYNNPSYMELFNLVYDKYFLFNNNPLSDTAQTGNMLNQRKFSEIKRLLTKNEDIQNDTLVELVILKGLYDGFFDDKFSRTALLTILDSLYRNTSIPEHLFIAGNIRSKVTRLLPGFVPSPFELYTVDGKLKSLNDFQGKYIYLNFCTTTSYACLQEFTLLEKLYEKHQDRLEVVTVSADRDIEDLKNLLTQTGYSWTFLHYGNKPEIIKNFDIRAFPTYFLIGPDNRLVLSPAPSPRENFEIQFFQHLRSKGEI